jgi:S-adenosylmethionine hydrolase
MITLASDFGSPYPAAMRGVVLSRCDARLVDVAHDFPRQNVRTAAFWLREVLPWFPAAVHCAVVDPGVGTDRDAIVVRAGETALVGPDNGLLLPAARAIADGHSSGDRGDAIPRFYEWRVEEPASSTFHGRDVFAPAAAAVHEALAAADWPAVGDDDPLTDLGPAVPTESWEDLRFPTPDLGERAVGEVLVVDGFGNAITNLPGDLVADCDSARVNGDPYPVARAYAERDAGEPLVTVGSHGNVELAVNRGRGDEAFGVGVGDPVRLTSPETRR